MQPWFLEMVSVNTLAEAQGNSFVLNALWMTNGVGPIQTWGNRRKLFHWASIVSKRYISRSLSGHIGLWRSPRSGETSRTIGKQVITQITSLRFWTFDWLVITVSRNTSLFFSSFCFSFIYELKVILLALHIWGTFTWNALKMLRLQFYLYLKVSLNSVLARCAWNYIAGYSFFVSGHNIFSQAILSFCKSVHSK